MKHDPFNESSEMYLKTISELAINSAPVSISSLAKRLQVTTVSATEMVHRLAEQALLEHKPYKGVCLTDSGQEKASSLIRTHHMWEYFLVEHLGVEWSEAHEHACHLEHATDTAVTEALAEFLNHPQTCPHGNPIPDAQGQFSPPVDQPLFSLKPGERGRITRISPESTPLLKYLAAHDLRPGKIFLIAEILPFEGPMILHCCGESIPLGQEIAKHIFVEKMEESV